MLVNNAGITHRSLLADTDVQVLRRVLEVNRFGAMHCTVAALPSLRARRRRIVAVSSVAVLPLGGMVSVVTVIAVRAVGHIGRGAGAGQPRA